MAVLSVLTWLVALELVGLCALPLAVRVFRRLDDFGYGLAKPLGLALVGYACWLLASKTGGNAGASHGVRFDVKH